MAKFRLTQEPVSLQQLSELEICKTLWVREVRKYLKEESEAVSERSFRCMGELVEDFLKYIEYDIETLELPRKVKYDLQSLAAIMSSANWRLLEDMERYGSSSKLNYIDHVKWTDRGTVDSIETMRSMYYSKVLPDSAKTWENLSYYCLDDCLADFFGRVKSVNYNAFQFRDGRMLLSQLSDDNTHILASVLPIYWSKRMGNQLSKFTKSLDSFLNAAMPFYAKSEDLNITMFWVAVEGLNFPATKYFWEDLTENQRIRIASKLNDQTRDWRHYLGLGGLELTVYLLKQWPSYNDKCCSDLFDFPTMIADLFESPWEDLFMRMLKEYCSRLNSSDLVQMGQYVCRRIFDTLYDSDIVWEKIFEEIWCVMDDQSKNSMDLEFVVNGSIGNEFLNTIINDPALDPDKRRTCIMHIHWSFEGDKNAIEQFCTDVLGTEEERKWFRTLGCHELSIDFIQ